MIHDTKEMIDTTKKGIKVSKDKKKTFQCLKANSENVFASYSYTTLKAKNKIPHNFLAVFMLPSTHKINRYIFKVIYVISYSSKILLQLS